ncbi:hypothetical protein [Sphingomonas qomolangmaensis]|uniref:Uncharacterized protein n=1 Tax=Sphingomonas qomolangmaensis TaxID=2918765 RepID=A0ABY5LCC6_9SPHN|nr:hypothetical protein [Sphingomonas qomolangmaensis]UUL82336.1 hypothetical protein NMP03_14340 [Sphingomonas qomolangmaensis]
MADLSRLPGSIAAARIAAQLPFGTGQGALSDAAEALALMVRARHHMARAHDRLREAGEEIGLDVTAFGDVFPCPPSAAADPGVEGPLRLVA